MHQIAHDQLEAQGFDVALQTKRGINLGCGTMIMPRDKPAHHGLLPDDLYTDNDTVWDNADSQDNVGVNVVCDLFDYPWRRGHLNMIAGDTYDVALATHLVEHIPHAISRRGEIVATTGGWWAFWKELGRVLKPDGIAHIITPYGHSRGGIIDPTHTRYMLPETFGYFAPDENAPFIYEIGYRWQIVSPPIIGYTDMAHQMARRDYGDVTAESLWGVSHLYLNMINEFAISLQVIK